MTATPRVAMLCVHTSPLDQPGTGDAGGMNVYVTELAAALAGHGAEVDIFTRATSSRQPDVVPTGDGVTVRHVPAGPFEGLAKEDLPSQMCAFTAGVLRAGVDPRRGGYDVVHSHYWLSGHVGWLAADRWNVPLVHTMHTLARVKNAALAPGDAPEPFARVVGEEQVAATADALVASTAAEQQDLVELYGANPSRVHVVAPGVDHRLFTPRTLGGRGAARARVGLPTHERVVLFAGRVQPLKGPDVLVRALGALAAEGRPVPLLVVLGGPSGHPRALEELRALARSLGVADRVRLHPPVDRRRLVDWYHAADAVAVPSRSESFGLVAAEAQAAGVPVVAAAVGGLRDVVEHGSSGLLVEGHDPARWADVLADLLAATPTAAAWRARLGSGAARGAERRSWSATAAEVLKVYDLARQQGRGADRAA